MPGKQAKNRIKMTIAMERELEQRVKAEIEKRRESGEKVDQSGFVAEALKWFLEQGIKIALILGVAYWLLGEDTVEGVFLGLEIAGTAAYYLATAAVYAVGFAVEVLV